MKKQEIKNRIEQLTHAMEIEQANNFPNGNLWNEMCDKVYCLEKYGQEFPPVEFHDENGYVAGVRFDDGRKLYYTGMTLENSYH